MSLTFFTVTQTHPVVEVETDTSSSGGGEPAVVPLTGTVSFIPSPSLIESPTLGTIKLAAIQGFIDSNGVLRAHDGAIGVGLVDNVDLGLASGGLTYRVDYGLGHPASFTFAAPGDGSTVVDLNAVPHLEG